MVAVEKYNIRCRGCRATVGAVGCRGCRDCRAAVGIMSGASVGVVGPGLKEVVDVWVERAQCQAHSSASGQDTAYPSPVDDGGGAIAVPVV